MKGEQNKSLVKENRYLLKELDIFKQNCFSLQNEIENIRKALDKATNKAEADKIEVENMRKREKYLKKDILNLESMKNENKQDITAEKQSLDNSEFVKSIVSHWGNNWNSFLDENVLKSARNEGALWLEMANLSPAKVVFKKEDKIMLEIQLNPDWSLLKDKNCDIVENFVEANVDITKLGKAFLFNHNNCAI
ncbi:hypothetical protein MHBO_000214 [Bonamia ostreae]|uniref:Uncharacterized protein n=1 Tax=Bonamia ostreae TaxID=126728 RepID=A0ABV2AET6_9EUKA